MTNYLRLDDNKKLLIMDRAFDKNRRIVGSKEYDLLQRAMADYPLYTVVLRHIKKNPNKKVYKRLTYDYMREYISRHPHSQARLIEFDEMILRAQCHANGYPKVKEWFLKAYSEIDDFTPEQYYSEQQAINNETDSYSVVIDPAA